MDSTIEQQRAMHEEVERIHKACVDEWLNISKNQREKLNAEHRINKMLQRAQDLSKNLLEIYADESGLRQRELQAMSGPDELAEFDKQLQSIRLSYRKNPGELAQPMHIDYYLPADKRGEAEEDTKLVNFSGEEGYGRFLDLHEMHTAYLNLKGVEKIDYMEYLSKFDHLFDIARQNKNAAYKRYIEQLYDYLAHFLYRSQPLFDLSKVLDEAERTFQVEWEAGAFPGWAQSAQEAAQSAQAAAGADVDLSKFSSAKELEVLGLDALKQALLSRGLKCGGTLQQRAERLFAARSQAVTANASDAATSQIKTKTNKDIAWIEKKIYSLTELLTDTITLTRENVERKLARTAEELREEEAEHEVNLSDEEEEQESASIYNPKDVPLDFDGKPMPYWLFKLHGLNIRFDCEICGGFSYRGPKAFQRHFQEWRHANGMRCLKIPNTSHFHNVTKIKDALALWDKLKAQKEKETFQPSNEEEYEDQHGNVFNKKTFEDLKREGLV